LFEAVHEHAKWAKQAAAAPVAAMGHVFKEEHMGLATGPTNRIL